MHVLCVRDASDGHVSTVRIHDAMLYMAQRTQPNRKVANTNTHAHTHTRTHGCTWYNRLRRLCVYNHTYVINVITVVAVECLLVDANGDANQSMSMRAIQNIDAPR